MICWSRTTIACLTLLATLTLGGVKATPTASPAVEPALENMASSQVRLRKLHLVRPDLIPYPIAYEVCC